MGEKMVAEEIAQMAAISQRILDDPAKLELLARRIKEVFADPKFVEKMKTEMAKLQSDEEIYQWLAMTQGSDAPRRLAAAFQVQPAAFRGATSFVPRGNAQMVAVMSHPLSMASSTEPLQYLMFSVSVSWHSLFLSAGVLLRSSATEA